MMMVVPKSEPQDPKRNFSFSDSTFEYQSQIGFETLRDDNLN